MITARTVLVTAFIAASAHISSALAVEPPAPAPAPELAGQWINGLGDQLDISPLGENLRLEIKNECYEAEILIDDGVMTVTPVTPDLFCFPKPNGVSGSLDAVRAALPLVKGYAIENDILSFRDGTGEILIAFDRIKE